MKPQCGHRTVSWMIYKSRKEYDQALKNLNDALYEGAHRAKREEKTPDQAPEKAERRIPESE